MTKNLLLSVPIAIIASFFAGRITIPFLKKIKAGQPILKYVETHKDKDGTPTMGGLFFILTAVVVFLLFGGYNFRIATVSVAIGLAFMIVGFLDDFIKVKLKHNEGLKAYQKIIFQFAIAIMSGYFAYVNGITVFHLPFINTTVNLGVFTVPIVAIIFIAITNSVNLTDGLDGLAGSVSVVYLVVLVALITVQQQALKHIYLLPEEYTGLKLLSLSLVGAIIGFLIFNVNKAKVFMGDTGSLSLGGFIGAISIFSSNSFFIPIVGIMFVASSISVIVQVLVYKRTKKRVFLMAPLHHHFQMKGKTETQIAYCYSVITALVGVVSISTYL